MSLPVHETAQGWVVAYSGGWNESTRRPIRGESWLSVEEARERYDSRAGVFEVVEAYDREGDELTRPRWVFGVTRREMVRTHFLNQAGSVLASVTYTDNGGRLFLEQRYDYEYPDAVERYSQNYSVKTVGSIFNADGDGMFFVRHGSTPDTMSTSFKDADFSSLWFDWPEFGDWDVFVNPNNGILPRDFKMTPQ